MQKAVFTGTVLCTRGRFLSNFTYTAEETGYIQQQKRTNQNGIMNINANTQERKYTDDKKEDYQWHIGILHNSRHIAEYICHI